MYLYFIILQKGAYVMKNRKKQRENRKLKGECAGRYMYNRIKDLTAYNADRLLRGGGVDDIVYK